MTTFTDPYFKTPRSLSGLWLFQGHLIYCLFNKIRHELVTKEISNSFDALDENEKEIASCAILNNLPYENESENVKIFIQRMDKAYRDLTLEKEPKYKRFLDAWQKFGAEKAKRIGG